MNISDYRKNNKLVGKYKLEYLDKELKGILASELVLIGARSGAGKTTIANQIAISNRDKKIGLFTLENYEGDLFMTELYKKYKKITKNYWLTFREFLCGDFNIDKQKEKEAKEYVMDKLNNISIVHRKPNGFNIEDMAEQFIEKARDGVELFVIDHIDYFDMHNPRGDENRNISEIMREIRKLQDVYKVPVVLISHLKKGTRETIIPTLEDFFGTSNKVKEATTVVLFAPDDEKNSQEDSCIKRTWICVRKDRFGGYSNKVCNIGFDTRTMEYEKEYDLYTVNYWGSKVTKIETHNPTNYQEPQQEVEWE